MIKDTTPSPDSPQGELLSRLSQLAQSNNTINATEYERYNVKRGLRNADGTGVLVGLTEVGEVHGYVISENEKVAVDGILRYRGIDVVDLVEGYRGEGRLGFEEVCYLLIFGLLPTAAQLAEFKGLIDEHLMLPDGFWENMILKAPSRDVMNKLARGTLALYSYDDNPDDTSIANVVRQSIQLIARFPSLIAYGYQAKRHYYDNESLYIHFPEKGLSLAENFLRLIRPSAQCTPIEAEILDLALILHAEHGGGNNSAFALHVVTSSMTDTYSAITAAIGSLKGPRHGGANIKVEQMMEDLKVSVKDWKDEDAITEYLVGLLKGERFDRKGLIYGMGHAVYTVSDPRTPVLRAKAKELAVEKNCVPEFELYTTVERLTANAFRTVKKHENPLPCNVDFYSGFVYRCLDLPRELYTPVFALGRIAGWCAHRLEELISGNKIIRPAYKNVSTRKSFIPIAQRTGTTTQG